MNKIQKVLVGAALFLGLAGLLVGLSNTHDISTLLQSAGSGAQQFGLIASKWTNFANSGVTTKVGYALTSADNSTTTMQISPAGVVYGVIGGSASTTLSVTTSTALAGTFDCQYDTVVITGTPAAATITFPPATSTAAGCLVADGTQESTFFTNVSTNTVTFATSTGDLFFWNNTSTPAANIIVASSTFGVYGETINAYRINSSSVDYVVTFAGVVH